jgi:thioredoxin reductase (NADPH)
MVYEYDVVVIGGGIAGFSAALYTSRQGLKTAVVTIDIGGQLSYASLVENYPGVDPLPGLNLVLKVQQQATSFGAEVFIDEVVSLEKEGAYFVLKTKKGEVFRAIAVIATCGKAPKRLGVPEEDRFVGKGLSYCVICDAPLYRGKKVALASFGEKGVEALEMLSNIAREIYYVTPVEEDVSVVKAKQIPNVKLFPRSRIVGLKGEQKVERIAIQSIRGEIVEVDVDGVFAELGFETRIDFLKKFVEINEKGEIIVDSYGRTKTEGLFAAGDVASTPYKQAVIAAASGVVAALSAINYVNSIKGIKKHILSDWEKKTAKPVKKFRL